MRTGCNLPELYKAGYDSKRAVSPTMMKMMKTMIIMMNIGHLIKNYLGPDLRGSDRSSRPESSKKQKWNPQFLIGYLTFCNYEWLVRI
jgi:hypothetical protein